VSTAEAPKIDEISKEADGKSMAPVKYPFHLTFISATIPLSLSAYISARHPRMTYLTSPNLHKLPRRLKVEHVKWTSGNHNSDVEMKLRSIWSSADSSGGKVLIFANKNSKVEELGEWLAQKGIRNVAVTSQSAIRKYGSNKHIAGFLNAPAQPPTSLEPKPEIEAQTAEVLPVSTTSQSSSEPKVLITTSLLSRGLDFSPSIAHVFILDSPRNMVDFLHRAGRTARAGRAGNVVLFQKEIGRGSAPFKQMKDKVRKLF
jgi:ATP-dependent RNA helicase MRH4, mitochondrial